MKQGVPWWFFFPDVTFRYLMWLLRIAAVPWGWYGFSRLMWLKYGACIRVTVAMVRVALLGNLQTKCVILCYVGTFSEYRLSVHEGLGKDCFGRAFAIFLGPPKRSRNKSIILECRISLSLENYFTSCDPHHDIYTFASWQIFWHSIWHIFWHSILHSIGHSIWHIFWHIFWHSIWQIFWHSIWHIFWHSIWHIFWHSIRHSIWHICWHSIWHIFWHSIGHSIWHIFWQIFWHSIWRIFWHSIWHSIWHIYLAYLMAFYLAAYLLAFYLTFYLAYLLAFYLAVEVQRCTLSWAGPRLRSSGAHWAGQVGPRLRSSGAHWAGQVPGWGPAVHTELDRSQVEVQRCTLSWEGPRLRSSGVHWAGTVPGWGPAVHTELGRSQVEVQRCTLSWEVDKELGEESWQRAWRRVGKRWKLMQTWSRRNWRRTRRRRTASRGGGGEQLW